ncbi:MAG: acyltransferase family protein [Chloroflexi bacterium]|nr:acyltransferase family protein [Chloroflexota bacterium]
MAVKRPVRDSGEIDGGLQNRTEEQMPQALAPTAAGTQRRYDVDWLRAGAVFSVIALHSAVIFSYGQFQVKHTQHTLTVDTIVIFLSLWIIPLLFVLAGAATKFALERRTPGQYSTNHVG